uniref:Apoptosis inhibitor 5/fibroblast growth factor 2-interacting factor 2 n=1 Tax=Trichuris muris TaxID=70415 RepID=A0A5S6Q6U2_TRIMR
MAGTVDVEALYRMCEAIDGSAVPSSRTVEFGNIIRGVEGGKNEKLLASQLICRYLDKFPQFAESALNAMFSLCEDEDFDVRKYVFKQLSDLADKSGPHVGKVADVLTQLLQMTDPVENKLIQQVLMDVIRKHTVEGLKALLSYVRSPDAGPVRPVAIKFLESKMEELRPKLTLAIQDKIATDLKLALSVVDGDDFPTIVTLLKSLSAYRSADKIKELYDCIVNQSQLNLPVNIMDSDRVDQILCCLREAVKLINDADIQTDQYVEFLLFKVLVQIQVPGMIAIAEDVQTELLRLTADMSTSCKQLQNTDDALAILSNVLLKQVTDSFTNYTPDSSEAPDVRMTDVEALLLMMNIFGKRSPGFFRAEQHRDALEQLRKRLMAISKTMVSYLTVLTKANDKAHETSEQKSIKAMAMSSVRNIIALVRGLKFVDSGPTVDSIVPSWKHSVAGKRKWTPTNGSANGASSGGQSGSRHKPLETYTPPVGKYSSKIQPYRASRYRGRGRMNWRRGGYGGYA